MIQGYSGLEPILIIVIKLILQILKIKVNIMCLNAFKTNLQPNKKLQK